MTDMEGLEPLVGEWTTEVRHPDIGVVHGEMSVEWLDGGGYLIQRSSAEDTRFPRGISLFGPTEAGDRIVQHYFDSRGVARVYGVDAGDGVWRIWRDWPGFSQRFTATFSEDRNSVTGTWDLSKDGATWERDLRISYRRLT